MFSKSYEESRRKFLAATKHLKQTSFEIVDGLTMDCAFQEKKGSDTIIILQSGVHGVEGYIGAAFQLACIPQLKGLNASLAYIHAVNPYGMKHFRRVNEHNVELNRNCLDDFTIVDTSSPLSVKILSETQHLLTPKRPRRYGLFEYFYYYIGSAIFVLRYGFDNIANAAVFGQQHYPHSVVYRGTRMEASVRQQIKYIKSITKGYKRAIFIDLHTGTGKRFQETVFTPHECESEGFAVFSSLFDRVRSRNSVHNRGVNHPGGFDDYFLLASKAKQSLSGVLEFGTVGYYSTSLTITYLARMIIAENQATFYGPANKLEKIRRRFFRIYSPQTRRYKRFIRKRANRFCERLNASMA